MFITVKSTKAGVNRHIIWDTNGEKNCQKINKLYLEQSTVYVCMWKTKDSKTSDSKSTHYSIKQAQVKPLFEQLDCLTPTAIVLNNKYHKPLSK